ncbi:hypothetical protein [Lysobacter gummosus]|uniref:hypothetical protein n=1 Tax=Lysobacter gummosus TaxID=262324 RepID=UPI003628A536
MAHCRSTGCHPTTQPQRLPEPRPRGCHETYSRAAQCRSPAFREEALSMTCRFLCIRIFDWPVLPHG